MTSSHLGTDWKDQWDRVRRWHGEVARIAGGEAKDQPRALDVIYAFYMNCSHLRDWLVNSGHRKRDEVDAYVDASDALRWCRDISNGMKHFKLDPTRPTSTYMTWTTTAESPVFMSGVGAPPTRRMPVPGKHWSFIDPGSGQRRDMFDLADECMKEWQTFLGIV